MVIKDMEKLKKLVLRLRNEGKRIVFTNGCFDILHAGHVDYLEEAKSLGDFLIVGMNSDNSVRKIKGEKRPIIREEMRAKVLAGLKPVDCVFVFEEESPLKVIKAVEPDVLVKGEDWPIEKIIGREFAKKVVRITFKYEISTTKIIENIVKTYCNQ